ncbi:hypothetical protein [Paracoccus benzoatiresistens]|uniref:Uncharacterized protein n=1 Tax=Paracoccus benzoatiresistens TaxID=2997341 RepID=A0ABT4JDH4_9RHOB|nr:hypothetical protein [Paracoccus sp. EF6]MCZ0964586.1 hypothetical protein [Paracoccus sp. EF6]
MFDPDMLRLDGHIVVTGIGHVFSGAGAGARDVATIARWMFS